MEWMGQRTDKGGLAWARFGKRHLPVRVITPELLTFHMEGLKKDSYCAGCGLPCVYGFSTCETHKRDWCESCQPYILHDACKMKDNLVNPDNELEGPQEAAMQVLRSSRKGHCLVYWLGEARVSQHPIKQLLPFTENFKKFGKKEKKKAFVSGVVFALVQSRMMTPRCQNEEMNFSAKPLLVQRTHFKHFHIHASYGAKRAMFPFLRNGQLAPIEEHGGKREIEDWNKVQYVKCACCPSRSFPSVPCSNGEKGVFANATPQPPAPECKSCNKAHWEWDCAEKAQENKRKRKRPNASKQPKKQNAMEESSENTDSDSSDSSSSEDERIVQKKRRKKLLSLKARANKKANSQKAKDQRNARLALAGSAGGSFGANKVKQDPSLFKPGSTFIPGERSSSRRKQNFDTGLLSQSQQTRLTALTGLAKAVLILYAQETLGMKEIDQKSETSEFLAKRVLAHELAHLEGGPISIEKIRSFFVKQRNESEEDDDDDLDLGEEEKMEKAPSSNNSAAETASQGGGEKIGQPPPETAQTSPPVLTRKKSVPDNLEPLQLSKDEHGEDDHGYAGFGFSASSKEQLNEVDKPSYHSKEASDSQADTHQQS